MHQLFIIGLIAQLFRVCINHFLISLTILGRKLLQQAEVLAYIVGGHCSSGQCIVRIIAAQFVIVINQQAMVFFIGQAPQQKIVSYLLSPVDKDVNTQLFSSFCHTFSSFYIGNEARRFVLNHFNIMIKAFEVGIPHRSSICILWSV